MVVRINLDTNDYQFRRVFSDSVSNKLYYVTALAVDPDGVRLAVHGSDTSQSIDSNDNRLFYGSQYSYIFTIKTDDGSQLSNLVRLKHGDNIAESTYQVWSSGFKLRNNGKVYLAFNMHLSDWESYTNNGGYEAKLRVGCYDSVNGQMEFYME